MTKTNNRNKKLLLIPLGNGWVLKYEDSKKFLYIFDKKKEAIDYAKKLNKELVIYDK